MKLMSKLVKLMKKLIFIIFCSYFFSSLILKAETPSNEELYKIILDLKKNQEVLLKNLEQTKKELQITENKLKQTESALNSEVNNSNTKVLIVDDSKFKDNKYFTVTPSFNRINTELLGFAKLNSQNTDSRGSNREVKTEGYAPGLNLTYRENFDDGTGWKINFKGSDYTKKDKVLDITQGGSSFLYGGNFIPNANFDIEPNINLDSASTEFNARIFELNYLKEKRINILDFMKFSAEYGLTAKYDRMSSDNEYFDGTDTLSVDLDSDVRGIGPTFSLGTYDEENFRFNIFSTLLFAQHKFDYYAIESDSAIQFMDYKNEVTTLMPSIGFSLGFANKDKKETGFYYDVNYELEHTFNAYRRHNFIDDTSDNHYIIEKSDVTKDGVSANIGYIF